MNDFDARMRRLFAGVETSPGCEARVHARVAALETRPAASRRVDAERRRVLGRRRLRREAWVNGGIVAGTGAAGVALILRHGAEVSQWVERIATLASDPSLSMGFALAVLAAGAWPLLRSFVPR